MVTSPVRGKNRAPHAWRKAGARYEPPRTDTDGS
jgi:hypothetical protein